MGGVASYNTAAHWALAKPDARPVSVFIGQKFAGTSVPYAASGIFAAPNGQGGCDGMNVQVVPSPLSCAKLRETLSAHGKQVGDLAGIPLMEDAGSQTMLVPTTANTCVLVGIRTAYAGLTKARRRRVLAILRLACSVLLKGRRQHIGALGRGATVVATLAAMGESAQAGATGTNQTNATAVGSSAQANGINSSA